ncbi:hypothetical protein [Leptothoe spongobia]|uniref:Uncharacterized protein n=1 Tax=Leptothoe spongobia TAU-MAC 1115 TaxID=1967444 RepID=A0A947DBC9_9CYAN|nr:hypothetical protein [Leptothoe spongobia]MBT9314130.1 hypothetical protein [Leptothoe spongobia TAU-MAC 1115]
MKQREPYSIFYVILLAWWFKSIVVPLITVGITIFFKANSKPNVKFKIDLDDWFICFDLCVSAIFIFIIGMVDLVTQMVSDPTFGVLSTLKEVSAEEGQVNLDLQSKITSLEKLSTQQNELIANKFGVSWAMFLVVLLLIFFVSTFIRGNGWCEDGKLKLINGIIIPNIIGFFVLVIVATWITF